jgi:predicted PurR-regulated permease PerM
VRGPIPTEVLFMKNPFQTPMVRMMLPYFVLALAVIIAFRIISEVGVILHFVTRIWGIITPFFYGFLLAFVLSIPCGGIEKLWGKVKNKFVQKKKRALSIIVVYILFFLTLYFISNLVIPYIISSISYFFNNINAYYEQFQLLVNYFNELEIVELSITLEDIVASLPAFSLEDLSAPLNMLFGAASAIFTAFLALVSSIYILFEKEKFKSFLCRLLKVFSSAGAYDTLLKYSRRLNENFKIYIYTQTIDGLILGTVVTVELYLLGSEFFLLLGIMLGILNYIPYFGSIFGTIIAVFVVLITQGLGVGLLTAVILLITQQLDGNVLQPKLLGGRFAMSPLLVIISITIGGAFAGVFGMIIALPIVAVLKDILEYITLHYEEKN